MVEKNNMEDLPHKYLANRIYDYYDYIDLPITRAALASCATDMQNALADIILQKVTILEEASRRSDPKRIIGRLEIITQSLDKLMQTVYELKHCTPPHDDSIKCSKAYCFLAGIFRPIAEYLKKTKPIEPNDLDNLIIALGYLSLPPILEDLNNTFENTIRNEVISTTYKLISLYKKYKETTDEHKKTEYRLSYIQKITYGPIHTLQTASTEVEKKVKRILNEFIGAMENYRK